MAASVFLPEQSSADELDPELHALCYFFVPAWEYLYLGVWSAPGQGSCFLPSRPRTRHPFTRQLIHQLHPRQAPAPMLLTMAPVTLKAIDLLKGSWTCPADAPSTGKRCCNPIGQRRRVDLEKLFGGLSVEYSSTILTRAAQQAICNRHQSQAANVSKTWTRLIQASPNHASARTCVAPGYQQSFAQAPRIKHEVPEHPDLKDLEIERLSRQVRDYMAECQASKYLLPGSSIPGPLLRL